MRTTTWLAVVMTASLSAWAFAGPQEKEGSDQTLEKAHKDLQQAIETIRAYHIGDPEKLLQELQELQVPDDEALIELRRPKMGILVESSSGDPAGALVVAVTPGGPADEAGLEAGDVITRVDGVPLDGKDGRPHDALIRTLVTKHEGESVTVDYLRGGEARSAAVVLESLDVDKLIVHGPAVWLSREGAAIPVPPEAPEMAWFFPAGWLDMEMVSLNAELGEYFGTDEGVLVVRGPSSRELDLRGGDVILRIDERAVKSPTHAMRILRSYEPNERLTIEVMRHGRRETIEGSVPEQRVPIFEGLPNDE
jgi:S1-C subfamily serine protease